MTQKRENDAKMKGKYPVIFRNYESYKFLFWATFSSNFCVVFRVFASLVADFFPGMIYINIFCIRLNLKRNEPARRKKIWNSSGKRYQDWQCNTSNNDMVTSTTNLEKKTNKLVDKVTRRDEVQQKSLLLDNVGYVNRSLHKLEFN